MPPKPARVFEYQTLSIGEQGLTGPIFERLVRYNELHGCKFFDVGHKKIRFKNYVGVIQAGRLVIEILPKADASCHPDETKWHRALIQMLHRSGLIKLDAVSDASLKLRHATLFDLYIESFLREVRSLVHQGLVRRYRREQGNLPYLKGKLILSKHITDNLLHKERFFTEHTLYDQDNTLNQILKAALTILASWPGNIHMAAEAKALLLNFEAVADKKFRVTDFARLKYDRNSERYRSSILLAKLIILEYLPDVSHGREHVLAILFDMNALFERYVFAEMKRAERHFKDFNLHLSAQNPRRFWGRRTIRPDIVADFQMDGESRRMVLDTKWKTLQSPQPADDDLRQMYAYNLHFGSQRAVLIYPRAICQDPVYDTYSFGDVLAGYVHGCGLEFVELFDETGGLSKVLGRKLIQKVILGS